MKPVKTKGICAYCKTEIQKNSRSIVNHILKCNERSQSNNNLSPYMIIMIQSKYSP